MNKLMLSVMLAAITSAAAGCATESDDPAEATESSAVTVGAWNYVQVSVLALRSCDSPSSCLIGGMSCGLPVFVNSMDWNTRMAQISSPSGWALADGGAGPNLSVTPPHC
ncbi:MAG TPA: hypothetical protein VH165_02785 [Kofleriaceae bacterium]|jgi:hypothetical protein|nr:hypothetical protein [Kofleriaceae bacterium]